MTSFFFRVIWEHLSSYRTGHASLFGLKRTCCWGGQAGEVAGVAAPRCCLLLEVPQPQTGPSGSPSEGKDGVCLWQPCSSVGSCLASRLGSVSAQCLFLSHIAAVTRAWLANITCLWNGKHFPFFSFYANRNSFLCWSPRWGSYGFMFSSGSVKEPAACRAHTQQWAQPLVLSLSVLSACPDLASRFACL